MEDAPKCRDCGQPMKWIGQVARPSKEYQNFGEPNETVRDICTSGELFQCPEDKTIALI